MNIIKWARSNGDGRMEPELSCCATDEEPGRFWWQNHEVGAGGEKNPDSCFRQEEVLAI